MRFFHGVRIILILYRIQRFFILQSLFFVGLFEYKRHNRLRFYLWELGPFILLMLYLIIGLWPYWGEIIQMLLTSAGIMDEA